jgi:DNA repair protein RecO (recombination protein O)
VPTYRVRGVVLRTQKLGESDRIVTIFAADGRQIRAVAKGSRKGTSRLSGRLQPYAVADLLLATGRSLDIVSEAETVSAHEPLRADLDRSAGASAIAELAEQLSTEGDPEPRVYELTAATLDALDPAEPPAVPLLVAAYYAKALAMHGWRPQLLVCTGCGREVRSGHLSAAEGGVLCATCAQADPAAPRMDEATHVLLHRLLKARLAELQTLDADADTLRRTLLLLRQFAAWHLGARLRAMDFLLDLPTLPGADAHEGRIP